MNTCEWKPSVIFPSEYMVSNNGNVKSVRTGKILKPARDKYGYYYYTLCVNGERRTVKAHRLVAMTYIDNPQNKPTVNHINGVRTDNKVSNLEWATSKEQSNDPLTREHILAALSRRDNRAIGALRDFGRIKTSVYRDGKLIGTFRSQKEAAEYTGVSAGKVSQCVAGAKKTCKGYAFKNVVSETTKEE